MTSRQTSGYLRDNQGHYIEKDPRAQLQYGVDWGDWIDAGDTISTSTWTLETTGTHQLILGDALVASNVSYVTITSGNTGTIYTVRNSITTGSGYKDTRRFRIQVEDRFL